MSGLAAGCDYMIEHLPSLQVTDDDGAEPAAATEQS